jgi:hypothetical protein
VIFTSSWQKCDCQASVWRVAVVPIDADLVAASLKASARCGVEGPVLRIDVVPIGADLVVAPPKASAWRGVEGLGLAHRCGADRRRCGYLGWLAKAQKTRRTGLDFVVCLKSGGFG